MLSVGIEEIILVMSVSCCMLSLFSLCCGECALHVVLGLACSKFFVCFPFGSASVPPILAILGRNVSRPDFVPPIIFQYCDSPFECLSSIFLPLVKKYVVEMRGVHPLVFYLSPLLSMGYLHIIL